MNVRSPVYRFKSALTSLNGDGGYGLTLLGIAILIAATRSYSAMQRSDSLRYDRAALAAGEWWRLVTCAPRSPRPRSTRCSTCMGFVLMWALFARDLTVLRQWLLDRRRSSFSRSMRACGFATPSCRLVRGCFGRAPRFHGGGHSRLTCGGVISTAGFSRSSSC